MNERYRIETYPTCITVDTTYRCNLKCKMCHQASKSFRLPENPDISLSLIEKMLPLIKKSKNLYLLGAGEPLMHPQIYELISMVKNYAPECMVSFTTNGTLLNEENRNKLIEAGLDLMSVSIDGYNVERGHQKVGSTLENLKKLSQRKKELNITYPVINFGFTAGKDNINELIPMLEYGVEIGIHSMVIEPLRIVSENNPWNEYIHQNDIYLHKDEIIPIFNKAKEIAKEHGINILTPYIGNDISVLIQKCDLPFRFYKVTMDGNVYMCPQGYFTNSNIHNKDPLSIWNSKAYMYLRESLDTQKYDFQCWNCPLVHPDIHDEEIYKKGLQKISKEQLIEQVIIENRMLQKYKAEIEAVSHSAILHAHRFQKLRNAYRKIPGFIRTPIERMIFN